MNLLNKWLCKSSLSVKLARRNLSILVHKYPYFIGCSQSKQIIYLLITIFNLEKTYFYWSRRFSADINPQINKEEAIQHDHREIIKDKDWEILNEFILNRK